MFRKTLFSIFIFFTFLSCSSELNQKKAQYYFDLALGLLEEDRYAESITQLETAARLDRSRSDIPMHIGLCQMKLERFDEAEATVRRACESSREFPECWNNLSYVYLKMNRNEEAKKAAEKALSISTYKTPDVALANFALAEIKMKHYDSAYSSLEKAKRLNPSNCTASLLMTKIFIVKNDYEESLRHVLSGRELCSLNPLPHLWEGFVYYKLGQRENAKEKYREILRVFKRGEAVELSRLNLEKMRKKIPLAEPPLL